MINLLIISFSLSYLYLIWFKSDFFVEYVRLFNPHLFQDYVTKKKKGENKVGNTVVWRTFTQYLAFTYPDDFGIKIISCPLCLSFWLSSLACILFSAGHYNFAVAFLSCVFYFISAILFEKYHEL